MCEVELVQEEPLKSHGLEYEGLAVTSGAGANTDEEACLAGPLE